MSCSRIIHSAFVVSQTSDPIHPKSNTLPLSDQVPHSSNPLYTGDFKMNTLANSEDPDEMPHYAAFHQGLHCLLRQKQSSEKYINLFEIISGFIGYTKGHLEVYFVKPGRLH